MRSHWGSAWKTSAASIATMTSATAIDDTKAGRCLGVCGREQRVERPDGERPWKLVGGREWNSNLIQAEQAVLGGNGRHLCESNRRRGHEPEPHDSNDDGSRRSAAGSLRCACECRSNPLELQRDNDDQSGKNSLTGMRRQSGAKHEAHDEGAPEHRWQIREQLEQHHLPAREWSW